MTNNLKIPLTSHHRIEADGVHLFYREAGPADAPVILLLHGFPTSSFQYRELIPRLADRYRVIAPDLPGFGFTQVPAEREYKYTLDALAKTIFAFTQVLKLTRYAMYVFDYGAPTGFRLALMAPERVTAIVSQNGKAYEEGLGNAWQPIQRYWREPTLEHRNAIREGLTLAGMHEYSVGIPDPSGVVRQAADNIQVHRNRMCLNLLPEGVAEANDIALPRTSLALLEAVSGIPDFQSIEEVKPAIVPKLVTVRLALITEVDRAGEDAFETVHQTPVMWTVSGQVELFQDFGGRPEQNCFALLPYGKRSHPKRDEAILPKGQAQSRDVPQSPKQSGHCVACTSMFPVPVGGLGDHRVQTDGNGTPDPAVARRATRGRVHRIRLFSAGAQSVESRAASSRVARQARSRRASPAQPRLPLVPVQLSGSKRQIAVFRSAATQFKRNSFSVYLCVFEHDRWARSFVCATNVPFKPSDPTRSHAVLSHKPLPSRVSRWDG